jgi:hypothetical protein
VVWYWFRNARPRGRGAEPAREQDAQVQANRRSGATPGERLVAAEIVDDDTAKLCVDCATQARKLAPLIGPSITQA